jgi:hypothetical protein
MKVGFLFTLAAGLSLAADTGMRPRGDARDYPAHAASNGVTIAAAVLSADDAKRVFGKDITRAGYLIMEVAVYPESGVSINLAGRDFILRAGSDAVIIRPVGAGTVAAVLFPKQKIDQQQKPPGNVHIYQSTTVGYETGSYGGRRTSGVYAGSGVGVAVGDDPAARNYPPPPPDLDPAAVRQMLDQFALPEGKVAEPVAGYLYFPKPAALKKKETYTLTWYGPEQVRLSVPPPAK